MLHDYSLSVANVFGDRSLNGQICQLKMVIEIGWELSVQFESIMEPR